ncbi:MAG: DUF6264 family protein [Galbitalea sp.]
MTDDRPAPQYGEYATPEQQAKAMGRPYVAPAPQTEPAAPVEPGQAAAAPPGGYANRFFTIFLLGLGALTLLSNVPTYFNYAASLKSALSLAGVSDATVPSSVNAIGVPTLVAHVVLYVATILVSLWALRRGRVSFYIPIVGWLVFLLVSATLVAIFAPGYLSQFAS